jgi:thiosulfate reductase cytochrome b subunit
MDSNPIIYSSFRRFFHWFQAILVFILLISGFEIHGSFHLLGFEESIHIHRYAYFAFFWLIVLSILWQVISFEFKDYNSSNDELNKIISPFQRRLNQMLKVFILPLQVISGSLYFYSQLMDEKSERLIRNSAYLHSFMAYIMAAALIVHLYSLLREKNPAQGFRRMITGK